MKTVHIIEDEIKLDMTVLAINSHVKGYNLCWHINKKLCSNFINTEIFIGEKKESFSAFAVEHENKKITLVNNKSKKGVLMPEKKNVDFFIIVEPEMKNTAKEEFISKLREISKILLIFEVDLEKEQEAHRFIIND
jgi:hypothetical protein